MSMVYYVLALKGTLELYDSVNDKAKENIKIIKNGPTP